VGPVRVEKATRARGPAGLCVSSAPAAPPPPFATSASLRYLRLPPPTSAPPPRPLRVFALLPSPEGAWLGLSRSSLASPPSVRPSRSYGPNQVDVPLPAFSELMKEQLVAPFFVFQASQPRARPPLPRPALAALRRPAPRPPACQPRIAPPRPVAPGPAHSPAPTPALTSFAARPPQVFCVLLWMLDSYFYYSLFTLFMLLTFESTVVGQRLRNLKELRSLQTPKQPVFVYRWVMYTCACMMTCLDAQAARVRVHVGAPVGVWCVEW
jgi:hypothetical protein